MFEIMAVGIIGKDNRNDKNISMSAYQMAFHLALGSLISR